MGGTHLYCVDIKLQTHTNRVETRGDAHPGKNLVGDDLRHAEKRQYPVV